MYQTKIVPRTYKEKADAYYEDSMFESSIHPEPGSFVKRLFDYAKFEEENDNFSAAEGYYCRILARHPDNEKAILRRAAILKAVDRRDNESLLALYSLLNEVNNNNMMANAAKALEQRLNAQRIYNTVAIEGNHMSFEQVQIALLTGEPAETKKTNLGQQQRDRHISQQIYNTLAHSGNTMSEEEIEVLLRGPQPIVSAQDNAEVFGMRDVLQFVQDNRPPVGGWTIDYILCLHEIIMKAVRPDWAGQFRKCGVYVGPHVAVDAEHVPSEMNKFVDWLNNAAAEIDPFELAALVHFKFVYVHPFCDGNGRMGRLLMDIVLEQFGLMPNCVQFVHRQNYYNVLNAAQEGDYRRLGRFILDQMHQMLSNLKAASSSAPGPGPGLTTTETATKNDAADAIKAD